MPTVGEFLLRSNGWIYWKYFSPKKNSRKICVELFKIIWNFIVWNKWRNRVNFNDFISRTNVNIFTIETGIIDSNAFSLKLFKWADTWKEWTNQTLKQVPVELTLGLLRAFYSRFLVAIRHPSRTFFFFFLFIVTQIQRRGNCRQFVHDSWVFHFCVPRERVKQKKIYLPPKCMKAQVSCAGGVSHPRRFRWGVTINLFQVPFKKRAHWPTIFLVRKHKFGPRVVTGLHAVAAIWPAFNTGRYFIGRTTGINANSDTFLGQE